MKLAVPLFFSALALAQQSATTSAPCSPIAPENTGTITINCPGMSKEQGQKMLAILNKIVANQLEPSLVMAKLDEIQSGLHRIERHQGWLELTDEQITSVKDSLSPFPRQTIMIILTNADSNKSFLQAQLEEAIRGARWNFKEGGNGFMGPTVRGLSITAKDDTPAARSLLKALARIFGETVVAYSIKHDLADEDIAIGIYDPPLPSTHY